MRSGRLAWSCALGAVLAGCGSPTPPAPPRPSDRLTGLWSLAQTSVDGGQTYAPATTGYDLRLYRDGTWADSADGQGTWWANEHDVVLSTVLRSQTTRYGWQLLARDHTLTLATAATEQTPATVWVYQRLDVQHHAVAGQHVYFGVPGYWAVDTLITTTIYTISDDGAAQTEPNPNDTWTDPADDVPPYPDLELAADGTWTDSAGDEGKWFIDGEELYVEERGVPRRHYRWELRDGGATLVLTAPSASGRGAAHSLRYRRGTGPLARSRRAQPRAGRAWAPSR